MITSEKVFLSGFQACFSEIKDFRKRQSKIEYPLMEVLFLTIVAIGIGAESWEDIEVFGQQNIEVLRQYLPYSNGTPSDDTVRIIMSGISKAELNGALYKYFRPSLKSGESIAIDGKTLCGSRKGDDSALHSVSAFATKSSITFSQVATKGKGNEINAIAELLDLIDIKGHVVTIDAIGTQKKIVTQIVEKGGDYVIALKRNQVALFNQVEELLNLAKVSYQNYSSHNTKEKAHGRSEERVCTVVHDVDYLFAAKQWAGLRSIIKVDYHSDKQGKRQSFSRYFISSCNKTAEEMMDIIRDHWKIENTSHWVLDVVLNEDRSRINNDNGAANMACIRRFTLNILGAIKHRYGHRRMSRPLLRKLMCWSPNVLHDFMQTIMNVS